MFSFFILSYIRNKKGSIKWMKKVNNEFVKEGKTGLFGNENLPVPNEKDREKMLHNAIDKGLNFIIRLEKKEILKMKKTIGQLKKSSKIGLNKL